MTEPRIEPLGGSIQDIALATAIVDRLMMAAPDDDLATDLAAIKGHLQNAHKTIWRKLKPFPLQRLPRKITDVVEVRGEIFEEENTAIDDEERANKQALTRDIAQMAVAEFEARAGDFRNEKFKRETLVDYVDECLMEGLIW